MGRSIPPETPRSAVRHGFPASKGMNRLWAEDWRASGDHRMRKTRHILRGCKKTCVAGHAAENGGVLVLFFALNDPMPECLVIGSGRDLCAHLEWRIEGRVDHTKRAKDFSLTKTFESFSRQPFKSDPENNETDIAVLGAGTRLRRQRCGERRLQEFVPRMGSQEQLFIGRQARRVG